MSPTPEIIVRLFVRQALLLITLIIIVAFPSFSQRQTSFVKSASFRLFWLTAFSTTLQPKTQRWVRCVADFKQRMKMDQAAIHLRFGSSQQKGL